MNAYIYWYILILYLTILLGIIFTKAKQNAAPSEELICISQQTWFKKHFKYWLLGNLISLTTGFSVIFFILFLHQSYFNIFLAYSIIFFGPFMGALIIKIIKKDYPWYFYTTVGIIYMIIFIYSNECLFFVFGEFDDWTPKPMNLNPILSAISSAIRHIIYRYRCISPDSEDYRHLLYTPIASLFGGSIVNFYRFLKARYKNPSSPYYK